MLMLHRWSGGGGVRSCDAAAQVAVWFSDVNPCTVWSSTWRHGRGREDKSHRYGLDFCGIRHVPPTLRWVQGHSQPPVSRRLKKMWFWFCATRPKSNNCSKRTRQSNSPPLMSQCCLVCIALCKSNLHRFTVSLLACAVKFLFLGDVCSNYQWCHKACLLFIVLSVKVMKITFIDSDFI